MTLEFHCTAASPSCVHFELPVMQPGHSPTDHPLFAGSVYQRAHFHPAKPKVNEEIFSICYMYCML